jgi:uncharacterized protein with ParB-like and HNH nuclease domain
MTDIVEPEDKNNKTQVQDSTGVWFTINSFCAMDDVSIRTALKNAKWNYPNKRVRVVDYNNRLIDVLD